MLLLHFKALRDACASSSVVGVRREHTQLANIHARDVVQWGQWLADTVWWIDNSSGKFLVVIARYTDCYMYRRETSWKRKITAPQVAATSLGSRRGSVACTWW